MKSVFFMPVYNEINAFPAVLGELRAHPPACDSVLLVNNGSDDGCEKLVRDSGFPYLDLEANRGIGYSYIRALDWALERDYDVFGTIASNGKMLPSEMDRLLDPILAGEADYVTGSRFLPGGASPNLPRFRRSAIPWVNRFVWPMTGVLLTDATCGYRALRLDLIRAARFDWRAEWLYTYGAEYYLYAEALLAPSVRCREVPITMRYPQTGPYTKIRPGAGWWAMLWPFVRARLWRGGFGELD